MMCKTVMAALLLLSLQAFGREYQLSREQWVRGERQELRRILCDPDAYLNKCTDLKVANCSSEVKKAEDICVPKLKMSSQIAPLGNGIRLGHAFGRCVGDELRKKVKITSDNKSEECTDGI